MRRAPIAGAPKPQCHLAPREQPAGNAQDAQPGAYRVGLNKGRLDCSHVADILDPANCFALTHNTFELARDGLRQHRRSEQAPGAGAP